MNLPAQLGVESNLLAYLPDMGSVRARYCVHGLPEDASLHVSVRARVYDLQQVRSQGLLPQSGPIAEGPQIETRARAGWTEIELPLPRLDYGEYAVVAKVYNRDPAYTAGEFVPSHCYVGEVAYGVRPVRLLMSDILALYAGVGNPLATEAIRNQIRAGLVVAEDERGTLYAIHEVNGRPVGTPLAGHPSSP